MKVLVIWPNGLLETRIISSSALHHLQKLVGGELVSGDIKLIHLGDCEMYVNEHSIAKDLVPNVIATRFAKLKLSPLNRELYTKAGFILGTAFVCGREITDCSQSIIDEVRAVAPWAR